MCGSGWLVPVTTAGAERVSAQSEQNRLDECFWQRGHDWTRTCTGWAVNQHAPYSKVSAARATRLKPCAANGSPADDSSTCAEMTSVASSVRERGWTWLFRSGCSNKRSVSASVLNPTTSRSVRVGNPETACASNIAAHTPVWIAAISL